MEDDNINQKCGYMEIKQSSKVKGRKLKTWRKRWIVVTKMTDLAAGTFAAKVDVFSDEASWHKGSVDRMTFVLDNVTSVQLATSKTHPFAFEISEVEPVLVLSGASESESFTWITALRHIFFAESSTNEQDMYVVTVQPNHDSGRLGLTGQYTMCISPEGLSLCSIQQAVSTTKSVTTSQSRQQSSTPKPSKRNKTLDRNTKKFGITGSSSTSLQDDWKGEKNATDTGLLKGQLVEVVMWRLAMLKRFNVDKDVNSGKPWILVIDCGPNSPCGEGTFRFITPESEIILRAIRRCISIAMATKQRLRTVSNDSRNRSDSLLTVMGYQHLLDRSGDVSEDGFGSEQGARPRSLSKESGTGSFTSTIRANNPSSPEVEGAHSFIDSDGGCPILPFKHKRSVSSFVRPGDDKASTDKQFHPQRERMLSASESSASSGLTRNCSVPSNIAMVTEDKSGYSLVANDDSMLERSGSLKAGRSRTRVSVCSGDSGIIMTGEEGQRKNDVTIGQVTGGRRAASNSFDSAVSIDSFTSSRKVSDVSEPILECPPTPGSQAVLSADRTSRTSSTSNIYQDIDNLESIGKCGSRRGSLWSGSERRCHSTGDVRQENDYEEVTSLQRAVATLGKSRTVSLKSDIPPELPARPTSLMLHNKSILPPEKSKSHHFDFSSLRRQLKVDSNAHHDLERTLLLSRSNSTEVYSTIPDMDMESKLARRRRSSDITPVSSRIDLLQEVSLDHSRLIQDSFVSTPYKAGPTLEIRTTLSAPRDLLSFSDNDLASSAHVRSGIGARGFGVQTDSTSNMKQALMDFFLNDATFQTNPLVTGSLQSAAQRPLDGAMNAQGPGIRLPHWENRGLVSPCQPFQGELVQTVRHPHLGWNQFPVNTVYPISYPASLAPWNVISPTNLTPRMFTPNGCLPTQSSFNMSAPILAPEPTHMFGASSSDGTGVSARVEGAYLDMTQSLSTFDGKQGCDENGSEYVTASTPQLNDDLLDFLHFH